MATRWRLLGIFLTFIGLFTLSWFLFARDKPSPVVALVNPKTQAELLVGTWELTERTPPLPAKLRAVLTFNGDNTLTLEMAESSLAKPSRAGGRYDLKGDTIRLDYAEGSNNAFDSWEGRIESITEDRLVLVGTGDKPIRSVFQRRR